MITCIDQPRTVPVTIISSLWTFLFSRHTSCRSKSSNLSTLCYGIRWSEVSLLRKLITFPFYLFTPWLCNAAFLLSNQYQLITNIFRSFKSLISIPVHLHLSNSNIWIFTRMAVLFPTWNSSFINTSLMHHLNISSPFQFPIPWFQFSSLSVIELLSSSTQISFTFNLMPYF